MNYKHILIVITSILVCSQSIVIADLANLRLANPNHVARQQIEEVTGVIDSAVQVVYLDGLPTLKNDWPK